ncbi:winged helix-turn-helix transcriptional regulator [Staphylococcus equorum]|uniref:winged helix-turn-helix transcriptional regulator n=1 Tax=Staphylococcus equorum TaxID=246432 RepID=UPI003EBAD5D9
MIPLDILNPKWVLDIIFQLKYSRLTYTQLLEYVDGINKRILSLTLKKSKREAIVSIVNTQEGKIFFSEYGHKILFIIYELGYWNK